jgi:hypothetical protein
MLVADCKSLIFCIWKMKKRAYILFYSLYINIIMFYGCFDYTYSDINEYI